MNKARLESTRNYFQAQDSYSIANVLNQARAKSKPFGLPLSISLTKIQEPCPPDVCNGEINPGQPYEQVQAPNGSPTPTNTRSAQNRNLGECVARRFSQMQIPGDIETALPDPNNHASSSSCTSLIRSTALRLRTRLKEFLWQDPQANDAISLNQGARNPDVKSYVLSLEGGLQLAVLEIDICIKQSIWEKFTHDLRTYDGLKSIALSEKGASLIQMLQNDIRIVLLSGAGGSIVECYDKILSDISLTENQVRQETVAEGWHPSILHRLHHTMRICKELRQHVYSPSDDPKLTTTLKTPSDSTLGDLVSTETTLVSFGPTDVNNNSNYVRTYFSKSFEVHPSRRHSAINMIRSNSFDTNDNFPVDNNGPLAKSCSKATSSRLVGEVLAKWTSLSLWLKKACGTGQVYPFNVHPPPSSTDVIGLRRIFSNSNLPHGNPRPDPSCSYPSQSIFLSPINQSITYKPSNANIMDSSSLEESPDHESQVYPLDMESIKIEIFPP